MDSIRNLIKETDFSPEAIEAAKRKHFQVRFGSGMHITYITYLHTLNTLYICYVCGSVGVRVCPLLTIHMYMCPVQAAGEALRNAAGLTEEDRKKVQTEVDRVMEEFDKAVSKLTLRHRIYTFLDIV